MTEGAAAVFTGEPLRILAVCTGNICRSPMTERLLQSGFDQHSPGQFVVESAGTGALVGNPIDPHVAGLIRVFGGSAENFSARQLTPELLQDKDLILALTREHRSRIVELAPAVLRRTFTLREFVRILPHLRIDEALHGPDRWRAALPLALRARGSHAGKPGEDDVVDPYMRDDETYQAMTAQILPALQSMTLESRTFPRTQASAHS